MRACREYMSIYVIQRQIYGFSLLDSHQSRLLHSACLHSQTKLKAICLLRNRERDEWQFFSFINWWTITLLWSCSFWKQEINQRDCEASFCDRKGWIDPWSWSAIMYCTCLGLFVKCYMFNTKNIVEGFLSGKWSIIFFLNLLLFTYFG